MLTFDNNLVFCEQQQCSLIIMNIDNTHDNVKKIKNKKFWLNVCI